DTQLGKQVYFFAQSRLDRRFDPSNHGAAARLDEYALRLTPWEDGRFSFQIGKFATVVGNYVQRHLSWENPFEDAPLAYENLTAISDKAAPASARDFIRGFDPSEKYEFNPVIWGPSYASGVSVSGRVGQFDYAAEMKNSSLSSRPESWTVTETGFSNPTFSARLGFRPDQAWNFGFSASDGAYFRLEGERTLPPSGAIAVNREPVPAKNAGSPCILRKCGAKFNEPGFEVPRVGNADTFAYYLEAKYKFTPQIFGAVRWNQQLFDKIDNDKRWGNDLGKIDIAATYRFTSHSQLKLQYSYQKETAGPGDDNHLLAAQFTVRF